MAARDEAVSKNVFSRGPEDRVGPENDAARVPYYIPDWQRFQHQDIENDKPETI
jgi:hypothetical protein